MCGAGLAPERAVARGVVEILSRSRGAALEIVAEISALAQAMRDALHQECKHPSTDVDKKIT